MKNIFNYITCVFFLGVSLSSFCQQEQVDFIPLNSNAGFEKTETVIVRNAKEIKTRLKSIRMNDFGSTEQFILIKLFASTEGCTKPYNEISLIKGKRVLNIEYKLIQRGFCKKQQSLSNTILISKDAFEEHEINVTTPVEFHTTVY